MGMNHQSSKLSRRALHAFSACCFALAAAAGAQPPTQEVPDDFALASYEMGPGDIVKIEVLGVPELDRRVRVEEGGSVSLPLLDSVHLAGKTIAEAERLIAQLLREGEYVIDPQVSIFIERVVSRSVSVQGAVHKPGTYQLLGTKSLLELLGEAGGLIGGAGGAAPTIYVLRRGDGGEERIDVDANALIAEGRLAFDVALRPGDTVIVPHDRTQRVYVSGAVHKPGPVEFKSSAGLTVLQAVIAAGGPTPRANLGRVLVLRQREDGTQDRMRVRLGKIQKGAAEDVPLAANDTVLVPEWFF